MEQQPAGEAAPPSVPLINVQTMRPGAPQKSVATVSPRVLPGTSIQRPGSAPSQGVPMSIVDTQVPTQQHVTPSGRDVFGLTPQNLQQHQLQQQYLQQQHLQQQHLQQQFLQQQHFQQHNFQQSGHLQQFPLQSQIQQLSISSASQPGPSLSAQHVRPLDNTKEKCWKFLANLLELSSKEPPSVERNVRALIQELIDGAVKANEFCIRLERLLNASPQPSLIGFLQKSLPLLRKSLALGELKIEGITPPVHQVAQVTFTSLRRNVALPVAGTSKYGGVTVLQNIPVRTKLPEKAAVASGSGGGSGKSMTINNQAYASRVQLPLVAILPGKPLLKEKGKKLSLFPGAYSDDKMAGDDDINDVAAMGGVNLQEESQRILGDSDMIGSQIRSCKEDYRVERGLVARVRATCLARGLAEPPMEVSQMLSRALDERMRTLIERLASTAVHRQETEFKEAQYEVTQDVRNQLRFLEDVDRAETRRREEAERELLMRAAKSRSKSEDPEQVKLKAKAKEMQRVEMEEVRQREANLTALQAIGPRKKPRLEPAAPAALAGASLDPAPAMRAGPRARPRRVTLRDMLHLLENDPQYARSPILYKAYVRF